MPYAATDPASTVRRSPERPRPPELPVVVVGAGPVGLAAARHPLERGLEPLVLEAGDRPAASVAEWGHVRMFSPWPYSIDAAAALLLARHGWTAPDPAAHPTGAELVSRDLAPLAAAPEIACRLRPGERVVAVAQRGIGKIADQARAEAPFAVRVRDARGGEKTMLARALGPLIDPNLHSCGTVPPHGAETLAHPEHGVFVIGMKSYGRAPTFLLATGHEQARSVAAFLAGDVEAALRVELALPETGVCVTDDTPAGGRCAAPSVTSACCAAPAASAPASCCRGPAPAGTDACCARDAAAKAAGAEGCGCDPAAPRASVSCGA